LTAPRLLHHTLSLVVGDRVINNRNAVIYTKRIASQAEYYEHVKYAAGEALGDLLANLFPIQLCADQKHVVCFLYFVVHPDWPRKPLFLVASILVEEHLEAVSQ
jgi:hypothetical protein